MNINRIIQLTKSSKEKEKNRIKRCIHNKAIKKVLEKALIGRNIAFVGLSYDVSFPDLEEIVDEELLYWKNKGYEVSCDCDYFYFTIKWNIKDDNTEKE